MKKRMLSILLAAAMLLTAVPALGAGLVPSGDSLIWYNDGTNASEFQDDTKSTVTSEGGAIKLSTTGTDTTIWQGARTGLTANKNSDIAAMLSFKIKAASTDKFFWLMIGDESQGGKQITTMAMTSGGMLSASPDSNWVSPVATYDSQPYAEKYVADKWYDVAMVFNSNRTIDYYLDGSKWFTASIADDNFNLYSANLGFRPGMKFSDKFAEPGTATFYLDDIMWTNPSDTSFYAFCPAGGYATENAQIGVKFTEQVTNTSLASQVKVYSTQSGAQVAATAAFDGTRDMTVTVSDKLSSASEYRIELPEFTGISGKKICTDNVYFTTENVGETVVNMNETFDNFTEKTLPFYSADSNNSYYYPDGWYLGFRWADQSSAIIKPVAESDRGTVMKFAKDLTYKQATSSIYYPLGEKINRGVTHISFDIKAEQYQVTEKADTSVAGINFMFTLYPEALTAAERDYTDGGGNNTNKICKESSQVPFIGLLGNQLGFAIDNVFNAAKTERWNYMSNKISKSIANPDNNTWYTAEATIDWSAGTVSYNIGGVTYESSDILSTLGIENGFAGIGFFTNYYSADYSVLIDNLKIETVVPPSGKVTETLFSDDFTGYNTLDKKGNASGEFYKPADWYTNTNWDTQYTTLKPLTTTQSNGNDGIVAEFKQHLNSNETGAWGWASLYRAFGKKVDSGVLTIEYDVKAINAANAQEDIYKKAQDQLLMGVYPTELTAEQINYPNSTDPNDLVKNLIGRSTSGVKFVGGVQGGAICKFKSNTRNSANFFEVDSNKDCIWDIDDNQAWHKVKVTLDYDNKTVATNVDGAALGTAYPMSGLGIEDGIYAVSFGSNGAESAWGMDVYLDNVVVQHTTENGGANVSKVRFADGMGRRYGLSGAVPTIAEKIEITFDADVDSSNLINNISLSSDSGDIILTNGSYDSSSRTFSADLSSLMKTNENYTLTVGGVAQYSADFTTDTKGEFIVSQLYIKKNGADVTPTDTISNGDVLTVGIKAVNTTGKAEDITFSYAMYDDARMVGCDIDEAKIGGNESALYSHQFTVNVNSDEITSVKGFAWGSINTIIPLTDFVSISK